MTSTVTRLSLRPREAAEALGISERTLWSLTKCGDIPHVKAGRIVLYRIADLDAWLAERAKVASS